MRREQAALLIGVALMIAAGAAPGCGPRIKVIPKEKIRVVKSYEAKSLGDTVNVPTGSLDVKRFADAQARVWDERPRLILARPTVFYVDDGEARPKLWTFFYKRRDDAAWLAVLVGRQGIVDAATRDLHDTRLARWPEIPKWTVDFDSTVSMNGEELVAVELGGRAVPVWRKTEVAYYLRYMNAGSDRRVSTTFIHALTNREFDGDTLTQLTTALDERPRPW